MTYLRATSSVWERLSGWWRCQDLDIDQQIARGARWFDLRVAYDKKSGTWRWAHGLIDLGEAFPLRVIDAVGECGGSCRITLERGDKNDESRFLSLFYGGYFLRDYPQVRSIVIKKGWRVWFNRERYGVVDRSYVPYHRNKAWWKQLKAIVGFPFSTIRKRAQDMRPTEEEEKDERNYYVYDFV